jgi:hypothetical protein
MGALLGSKSPVGGLAKKDLSPCNDSPFNEMRLFFIQIYELNFINSIVLIIKNIMLKTMLTVMTMNPRPMPVTIIMPAR